MSVWEFIADVGPASLGLFAGVTAFVAAFLAKRSRRTPPIEQGTLADRIQRLSSTAVLAKVLADEISAEVTLLASRAEKLSTQAEEAEKLAELNDRHRQAVAAVIREELGGQDRAQRKAGFLANGLWFVAGVIASIAVTLFVQPVG